MDFFVADRDGALFRPDDADNSWSADDKRLCSWIELAKNISAEQGQRYLCLAMFSPLFVQRQECFMFLIFQDLRDYPLVP